MFLKNEISILNDYYNIQQQREYTLQQMQLSYCQKKRLESQMEIRVNSAVNMEVEMSEWALTLY